MTRLEDSSPATRARGGRGPDDSAGILLWRAANAWQRRVKAISKAHGITQAQFVLLLGLHHLDARASALSGPTTQTALSQYCGVDTAMASQVLRQLETGGYLRRAPGNDARSHALYLTESGQRVVSEVVPMVSEAEARFFSALGDNAEMFKAALQVLLGLPPRMTSPRRRE